MNVVKWGMDRLGAFVQAPGGLGGQCVDLANLYVMARGAPAVRLNAADWYIPKSLPGWVWEPNGPRNYPPLGAVVVWNRNVTLEGIGENGHVAVAMAADSMAILSIDQGWPAGSPVALMWHSYRGVLGWWHLPR